MGESTAIGWTDHTFNPWWGCARVSPGCEHCYAEAFAKRTGHAVWGKSSDRRFFGDKHWAEPLKWNAAAEQAGRPALVFCASMADVFEDRRDLDETRARLFELIPETPWLIWQLLTKRPEHVLDLVPDRWKRSTEIPPGIVTQVATVHHPSRWPSNCWIGTTVEDQRRAGERIPLLIDVPAPVRFLSCEPLLGRVDLSGPGIPLVWLGGDPRFDAALHWVIAGGESGPGHRPLDLDHARALRDQCRTAGVPFFFKQVGGRTPTAGGDLLDGKQWKQFPSARAMAGAA